MLLLIDQLWYRYHLKHEDSIPQVVVETMVKILACGTTAMGYDVYTCTNPLCIHLKIVCFSCKCRFCNTCGYKATEQWIKNQLAILPTCPWQHITFTMPGELWLIFEYNRQLLGEISRLGARPLLAHAKNKGITPGLFTALHSFGRDLKYNVHMHISITCGGLNALGTLWKTLYFPKHVVMPMWRRDIIELLRKSYDTLTLPEHIKQQCPDANAFNEWLDVHYQKNWIVHFAKPTKNPKKTIKYLGRYIKRPPLSMARLIHYDGKQVVFKYLDHVTKRHRQFNCEAEDFIERLIKHIPAKHFRLIRYYGFLANRVRGTLLPSVRQVLGQMEEDCQTVLWPQLLKSSFGLDPLKCIVCGSPMQLKERVIGKNLAQLMRHHDDLALMKPVI